MKKFVSLKKQSSPAKTIPGGVSFLADSLMKETVETAIWRLNHDASHTRSSIGGALQIDKDSKKGVQESVKYTLFAHPFGRLLSQIAA